MSATPAPRSAAGSEKIPALDRSFVSPHSAALEVCSANAGDHAEIFDLLVTAGAAPSREDFLASQDNPHYEPSDRLLVRMGQRLIGHLQVSRRVMPFAGIPLPVAILSSLVVLPEYQGTDCSRLLMEAAERYMREDGTILAITETRSPQRYAHAGWIDCGRQHCVRAGARDIRAHLASQPVTRAARKPISTRVWRHVELRQLTHLFRHAIVSATGPLERSEDYWQWLVSRQAYDQILVAIEGSDTLEFGEQAPQIVGYAVTRDAQVVEIVALDPQEEILRQLMVRACREAIERDHHTLRVHVPPCHGLGKLLATDGASRFSNVEYSLEHTLVKIIEPEALVGRIYPLLQERARSAGIPRPLELNLALETETRQLILSRRSARLAEVAGGRPDVTLSRELWDAMLLGQADLSASRESGRLKTRTKALQGVLETLFPRVRWWRPALDGLEA